MAYDLSQMGTKICWVDTETTGLSPESTVIQLAAVSNLQDVPPFYAAAIIPDDPAALDTPEAISASQIHGLTASRIREEGRPAAEVWRDFQAWCHRQINPYVKGDKLLMAGYNVAFDQDQLRSWWRDKFFGSTFWSYRLDVMGRLVEHLIAHNMLEAAVGGAKGYRWRTAPDGRDRPENLKLGTVAAWMAINPPEGADLHNALADIELTRRVYLELRRRDRLDARGDR